MAANLATTCRLPRLRPPLSTCPAALPCPPLSRKQTQEMWSFVVPAVWLAFFATPDQLARLSAPANALLMALFLLHYLNR